MRVANVGTAGLSLAGRDELVWRGSGGIAFGEVPAAAAGGIMVRMRCTLRGWGIAGDGAGKTCSVAQTWKLGGDRRC